MNKVLSAVAVSMMAVLVGCGGGGGSSAPAVPQQPAGPQTETAYFVDSPVQGLVATSGSTVSVTDAGGAFSYEIGKPVTFSIGGIVLGSAMPQRVMTPATLDGNTLDLASTKTTNLLRFLQTIDADGNPDNGIVIKDTVRQAASSMSLDFSAVDFGSQPTTQHAVSVLSQLTDVPTALVSAEQARMHFRQSMGQTLSGSLLVTFSANSKVTLNMRKGKVASASGTTPAGETVVSGGLSTDGTLVLNCSDGMSSSTACMTLTVMHNDGGTAEGSYTSAAATGTWTSRPLSAVEIPVCGQQPQTCK